MKFNSGELLEFIHREPIIAFESISREVKPSMGLIEFGNIVVYIGITDKAIQEQGLSAMRNWRIVLLGSKLYFISKDQVNDKNFCQMKFDKDLNNV